MSRIEELFIELTESLESLGVVDPFRPGGSRDLVIEKIIEHGADPIDELVEWWTIQDGLTDGVRRLPFGYVPESLESTLGKWAGFLEMIASIEADEEDPAEVDALRALEFWPQPGWFPLSMASDARFLVDTFHVEQPGRVLRRWADQLEVYAPSLEAFIAEINDLVQQDDASTPDG